MTPRSMAMVTAPVADPVTWLEIKEFARIDNNDEDALVAEITKAAVREAETITRRRLITQTWRFKLDGFPKERFLVVPFPPLASISSISYVDTGGTSQTWAAANYVVDTDSHPGIVNLAYSIDWPSTRDQPNAVTVQFICGYGTNPEDIPEEIRLAIKYIAAEYFERETTTEFATAAPKMRAAALALLQPYRDLRAA